MKIRDLIWLDDVVDKLAKKHGVDPGEVTDLLRSRPHFRFVERGHRSGEDVYAALGQTGGGRYLIVFFVLKKNGCALVVSAREMTASERKRYEKK